MRILLLILLVICTAGCGISGTIDRSTVTAPDGTITENCKASYSNTSWGTATSRGVHGCDAGGDANGIDNTASVQIPIAVLNAIVGAK